MVSRLAKKTATTFWNPLNIADTFNNLAGIAGIGGKMILEDIGLASKDTFTKAGNIELGEKLKSDLLKEKAADDKRLGLGKKKKTKKGKGRPKKK
jgi:hypothetical protein